MTFPGEDTTGGTTLLETVPFTPVGTDERRFTARLSQPVRGEVILLLTYRADRFPFEKYCRYARHRGEPLPYTFDQTDFAPAPPGIRVGPWPGWRGIPEFPPLSLLIGEERIPLSPALWGDEMTTRRFRAFCRCAAFPGAEIVTVAEHPGLDPAFVSIYRTSTLRAKPRPVSRTEGGGLNRPSLLIPPADLERLRSDRSGVLKPFWDRLEETTAAWDLPFEVTPTSKAVAGPQRLSGEDRVFISAFLALLDPTEGRITRALSAFREYRAETEKPDFPPLAIDTQSGEVLFQLSVGYDWLSAWMSESEREEARGSIRRIAQICKAHLTPERRDYGQAHYLGCGLGLLAYSLLFRRVDPHAEIWLSELRGALDAALRLLPADGAYPHGVNLWVYEHGFLLRWIELLRTCTGEDLWRSTPALRQISGFRAATIAPDPAYAITFGDPQYHTGGDSWLHFLVARRTGSRVAQWTGHRLLPLSHEGIDFRNIPPRRRVYEFLYYDPTIAAEEPPIGPTVFHDTGQIFQRTADLLFTFRAGPPLGMQRYAAGEPGAYGHSDPANGAFLLCGNGTLLASGPGPVYRRDTSLHNILTVDGEGQLGDSTVWLPDFIPPERLSPLPRLRADGRRSAISWEGTVAYLPHLGIQRLTRALFVDLDHYIIGMDSIRCDRERLISWNLHSWEELRMSPEKEGISFRLSGDIRFVLLASRHTGAAPMDTELGMTRFVPAYPNDGRRDSFLRFTLRGDEAIFVWALLLSPQKRPSCSDDMRIVTCADGLGLEFDGQWLLPEGFDENRR